MNTHGRQSIRLNGYDYARSGAYFATICAQNHARLFGDVINGVMLLSEAGVIVDSTWRASDDHFAGVTVDEFVVMPNHVHGVLTFDTITTNAVRTTDHGHKSAVSKRINEHRGTPGAAIWKRNYYEHIIRDDDSLHRICRYIRDNPAQWTSKHSKRGDGGIT